MIEVRNLRKVFGGLAAVDDVSFTAPAGAIFGLLGPNGAGKSTTIGCIDGLVRPTAGTVTIDGHDVVRAGVAARRRLGVVPQELAIYEDLSARTNLRYWGAAHGLRGSSLLDRVATVLAEIELEDRADEQVAKFSGGMKRRLNFGCGIVHEPDVLLLDEPTVGVDPQSRVKLLDLVRSKASAGACVLYTTHYMEEAEALCDRIAILDHGRLLVEGSLDELRAKVGGRDLLRLTGAFPEPARTALARLDGVEVVQGDDAQLSLAVEDASHRLSDLFGTLSEAGASIHETTLTRPNLENLFIQLTGKELRE